MKVKVYTTKATAKAAVKRQGLHNMTYEINSYRSPEDIGFTVKFYVMDFDDWQDIIGRGFEAEIDPRRAAL